ncbi:MAG TPA: zinc-ribbon domain-containing protein [Candidatus Binatia bacterium]|nr:zinc-ribbon domain-containing protein [Candidatus Binatia bacterium]
MAFCPHCGNQLAENVAFCPACGKAAGQPGGGAAAAPQPAPQPPPPVNYNAPAASSSPLAENIAGMLAYFTIIPAIVFLLIEPYNRNPFVRFHSFQCLFTVGALIVVHIALSVVGYALPLLVLPLWGLLGLAELALWILLVVKAYQHEMFKLPVVGDMAEKQAAA